MSNDEEPRRIALITGGGRGIGAATARTLAHDGWDLCLGYRSNGEAAEGVAAECEDLGVRTLTCQVDVADEASVAGLFGAIDTHWSDVTRLGALVNNAGVVDEKARVDEMRADRLSRMFAVNVIGSFLCAGQAVRRMSTRQGGRGGVIVNLSSAAARLGSPGEYVDYAASKGAIDTMTIGLAKEVADEGIRVVAVRPGLIDTEIHASGGQPDRGERLRPLIPMQRVGRPDEVAATIAWLCGPAASYVTGALLDVSGGR
ncbi:MAG TPA: SDR family oxidoreductase [Acidimicrobiales bacterium]|jgi:NAD(P)-dependent dehydrogenase (short-subunit alcohol dehydrogenase family)|nr:SDR family oxidoreductase [Acidimicrobiales bacterium]